jgi:hypothetical protein
MQGRLTADKGDVPDTDPGALPDYPFPVSGQGIALVEQPPRSLE